MDLASLERILKALANRKRLQILKELKRRKSADVTTLARAIGLSMQATSIYLQHLHRLGIIKRRKRGQIVIYRLALAQGPLVKKVLSWL